MKKLLFMFVAVAAMMISSCGKGTVTPVSDNDSIDTTVTSVDTVDTVSVDTTICVD